MRDGLAHGVFLSNSNGMDIKINQTAEDGQYLEYNAIGGVLDFYFLSGPAPADVARQYAGVVGTVCCGFSFLIFFFFLFPSEESFTNGLDSPLSSPTGHTASTNASTVMRTS